MWATPVIEMKKDQEGDDLAKGFWQLHHLVLTTIIKFFVCTARRFGYTFAPFLSSFMGVSAAYFSLVLSLSELASALLPVIGPLSDHFGHIRAMSAALVVSGFGVILVGFGRVALPFLFFGFILILLGYFTLNPSIQAELSLRTPKKNFGRYTGILEIAWAMSSLAGLPLLGQVFVRVDPRIVLFSLGGLIVVSGIAIRFILPSRPIHVVQEGDEVEPTSVKQIFKGIKMVFTEVPFILVLFCSYCLNFGNTLLFAVYATWFEEVFHLNVDKVAILTVAIGGAELAGSGIAALFSDRIGIPRFVLISVAITTGGYIVLAFIGNSHIVAGIASIFLCCAGFEMAVVALFSLVPLVAFDDTASFMAATWLCLGLGSASAAGVSTLVWKLTANFKLGNIFGIGMVAFGITLAGLVALFVALMMLRRRAKVYPVTSA